MCFKVHDFTYFNSRRERKQGVKGLFTSTCVLEKFGDFSIATETNRTVENINCLCHDTCRTEYGKKGMAGGWSHKGPQAG